MFRWLKNLFRRKPRYAFSDADDDPYMKVLLSEVIRTRDMVHGEVTENGGLELKYADGSRRILSRDEVLKRG